MTQGSELEKLESFVENLLRQYTTLKKAKEALEQSVSQKNSRIEELESTHRVLKAEKEDISERVTNLINQIEAWEGAFEGQQERVVEAGEVEVVDGEEKVDQEEDETDENSAESRQGKLFAPQSGDIYTSGD